MTLNERKPAHLQSVTISLKIPAYMLDLLEETVAKGYFLSRSEALRQSFLHFLECTKIIDLKQLEEAKNV